MISNPDEVVTKSRYAPGVNRNTKGQFQQTTYQFKEEPNVNKTHERIEASDGSFERRLENGKLVFLNEKSIYDFTERDKEESHQEMRNIFK